MAAPERPPVQAGGGPEPPGVGPGWYLLTVAAQLPPSARGYSLAGIDPTGQGLRIPLRPDEAARGGQVVLLPRGLREARVAAGGTAIDCPVRLEKIGRLQAARRMLGALRRQDGSPDWALVLRALWRSALGLARGPRAAGDALVAAYDRAAGDAPRCVVDLGWGRPRGEFLALEQLRAASGLLEATGEDPKMVLHGTGGILPLAAGWYAFDATVEVVEGQLLGPSLYPDFGQGTAAEEVIELPAPGQEGRIHALILLKYPVRSLRFDPTRRHAVFRMSGVRLRRIGRARALARMLVVRDDTGPVDWQQTMSACREFVAHARSGGLATAAVAMFARHRRHEADAARSYGIWARRYDDCGPAIRAMLARRAERLRGGPTFSVLLPVYQTPERWLRQCIESVLAQAWPRWELCVVDDASPSPQVRRIVQEYAGRDPRIRLQVRTENGHISAASNTALEMARGDYVALLDHDDLLRPHALLEMAEAIAGNPALELLYSDEDKVDESGRRFDPYFKPDWNADLLLGQNYVCHLTVLRTALARSVGGFRTGYEGSQDHDLVLRCSRALAADRIRHVPKILYHWRAIPGSTALRREDKDYAAEAGARAVQDHVRREAPDARVEILEHGHYRVHWPLPEPAPRVSLIVPTRDRPELLRTCVRSLLERTQYPDFEVLVVDNRTTDPEALSLLDELGGHDRVRVLRHDAPFNYSRINNRAAAQASGSVLALVNNDIEVITPDWLREMVSLAVRPGVGAVGPMLLYPDGRIQHAGVILGLGGIANHAYAGEPGRFAGHGGRARVVQSMSAVTGACLVVRRELYARMDGLDERLQVAFNDIDFCLRLREAGHRNLWTPFARLYHHESVSRGRDDEGEKRARFLGEVALMQERWGALLQQDPAYNPNLSLAGRGFELADPPRS